MEGLLWELKCCLYACPGVRPNLSVLAQERAYPVSGLLVSVPTPPSSVQACLQDDQMKLALSVFQQSAAKDVCSCRKDIIMILFHIAPTSG